MCGRYVLRLRPSEVRQRLEQQNMPVEESPDDDDGKLRQSYNFAPGYHGLIYRAKTSDRGGDASEETSQEEKTGDEPSHKRIKLSDSPSKPQVHGRASNNERKFKLQTAKWGLVPFWTKRPPDYGSQMRTINCRDDSLIENRGMWNTMKQRKRCIVLAEGFYEWKKENNGKIKIPHHIKRKDGELMCFAGLWDMVQYEGSEEKLYTYTIITTDSNKQLKFLHDRMPVILEPASEEMKQWLNPSNIGWSKELQSMLKPFTGELECYPVDKAVGKVGNDSPTFVVPIDSKENKSNIANFFDTQRASTKGSEGSKKEDKTETDSSDVRGDQEDNRATTDKVTRTEDNAPLPKPENESKDGVDKRIEEDTAELPDETLIKVETPSNSKPSSTPPKSSSTSKKGTVSSKRKRNPTSNDTVPKTPTKQGNMRITNFLV